MFYKKNKNLSIFKGIIEKLSNINNCMIETQCSIDVIKRIAGYSTQDKFGGVECEE